MHPVLSQEEVTALLQCLREEEEAADPAAALTGNCCDIPKPGRSSWGQLWKLPCIKHWLAGLHPYINSGSRER